MASRLAILIAVLAMAAAAHAAKPAAKPYPQDLKGLCTKGGCDYTSGSFDYWTVSTITPTSRLSIPCASWQNRLALPLVPVSGPDFLPLMARAHFLLPPSASSRLPHAQIPEYGACVSSPPSSSKPYCAAGSIHAKACCNKCSNTTGTTSFNCRFWVHIPYVAFPTIPSRDLCPLQIPWNQSSGGSSDTCSGKPCGKCILLPAIDGIEPVKGGGKKIRIGKACPTTKDDPHFLGAHGTRFEFNGLPEKSFCLYTDRQMHINMGMRGYYDDRTDGAALIVNGKAVRTWIRQLAIMWRSRDGSSHSFVMTARDGKEQARGDGFVKSIVADTKALPRMKVGESKKIADLTLTFNKIEKVGPYDVDAYTVKIGDQMELDLRLRVAHPLLQTPDDAETHINVMFTDVAPTADVHGVMGQTYRTGREKRTTDFSRLAAVLHHPVSVDGAEGKGFLDGKVSDYETSSVTATDCRFSAFNTGELPAVA
ncbi:unnamed protein product [Closterium sp. NIES-65]|nr:unnamed protein product [Closterium sp. NIES-65]